MGFMDWERFRCNIDCADYPDECLSEKLFMTIADAMVEKGLQKLGYTYLSIDDCWMARSRTADGKLQADPVRFPSGIKALAGYMHDRGLKLGIYEDYGTYTCMGYPGSQGYEKVDAQTFAEWEVDMLKFDGCYSNSSSKPAGYINMGEYLNQTGRPILYACSWPAYISNPNYTIIAETCNQWRNQGDIQDYWGTVLAIINVYAKNQDQYAQFHGPGQFNDPDELLVGDNSLSHGQEKIHMSIWCLWSAPLLVSADIRNMKQSSLDILKTELLIKIDQDSLGNFAKRVVSLNNDHEQIWVKTLGDKTTGVNAICFFNARTDDQTVLFEHSLKDLGVLAPPHDHLQFLLVDVFTNQVLTNPVDWDEMLTIRVEAFDAVTVVVDYVASESYHPNTFAKDKTEFETDEKKDKFFRKVLV